MTTHTVIKKSFLTCLLLWAVNVFAQAPSRTLINKAFQRGEVLKYRLHYGVFDAGTATLNIQNENKIINGHSSYHVIGIGETRGTANLFYKVYDRYETFIDEQSISPLMFVRRVDEGGYKIKQDIVFDQEYHVINSNGKQFHNQPDYIQDMLSAFYYARTFPFDNETPGKVDSFTCFVDDKVWTLKIKFVRYDTLKSSVGKVRCMVFEPIVQTGRIFKKSEDLQVWISDDNNHIPLRAQANILVGSIRMDLVSYSGLVSDFDKLK